MPSTPDAISCHVDGQNALDAVARAVAAALPAHAFVALSGDLGAGKTTFVKAVAAAIGIDPHSVVSPTFGLIHEHAGRRGSSPVALVHADLYRLAGASELHETGWDDAIAPRSGKLVWAFVEWPERLSAAVPAERLDVAIEIVSDTGRTFTCTARGPSHRPVVSALQAAADQAPAPPPR
jgi:tRNA threonylcarbamoyl adenosine modification protein YjeE